MLVLGITYMGFSQKIDLKLTNKVTINRDSDYVYAYTLPEKSTFSAKEEKVYFWYLGGSIKSTRGGYEGKLLDGDFICFYHNKNLEEKGAFKKGLKTGKWMHWYKNGELKSVYKWKKGKLVGKSYHYDSLHNELDKVVYKRGMPKVKKKRFHKSSTHKQKKPKENSSKKVIDNTNSTNQQPKPKTSTGKEKTNFVKKYLQKRKEGKKDKNAKTLQLKPDQNPIKNQ